MNDLSELFKTLPEFLMFDELVTLPQSETSLGQYDFMKIHKIIDDIGLYLTEVQRLFNHISVITAQTTTNLEWYFQGKVELYELNQNIDSIDGIIARLLLVIDTSGNAKHIQYNHLLNKFEETSDLLLEIKKLIIIVKRKVDISINFRELNDITIKSLNTELELCLQLYFKLQDILLLSPKEFPKYNLQEILSKMKINNFTSNIVSLKSIKLPTFNDLDETLYTNFLMLENKLQPLKVAIEFLPLRIEEFISISTLGSPDNLFPQSLIEINKNYESLLNKYEYLLTGVQTLKTEQIDAKWNSVFIFLIQEIIKLTLGLLHEFELDPHKHITKKVGDNYRICLNSLTIIKSAVNEGILHGEKLISLFNDTLLPNWNQLNDILTSHKRSDEINDTYHEYNGLRGFQTKQKRNTPKVTPSPIRLPSIKSTKVTMHSGLGIDLGLDVEHTQVPISIKPADKIIDIQQDIDMPSRNLIKQLTLTKTDDEETLVPKTPKNANQFVISHNQFNNVLKLPLTSKIDDINKRLAKIHLKDLLIPPANFTSRIHRVRPDYQKLKLPSMKQDQGKSRIPRFVKTVHYQLQSPLTFPKRKVVRSLSSSYFSKNDSPIRNTKLVIDNDLRHHRMSSDFLTSTNLDTAGINLAPTPDLSYPRSSPSYSSTSPDRPTSSIGSRYDDENLLQPLKYIKPSWRG